MKCDGAAHSVMTGITNWKNCVKQATSTCSGAVTWDYTKSICYIYESSECQSLSAAVDFFTMSFLGTSASLSWQ